MKPQKRMRSSKDDDVSRDRLSELPDEVIVHILSSMPTLDAVRTVLLRRFGNLWTLVHTLNFDYDVFCYGMFRCDPERNYVRRFSLFIRNVLMLHQRLSIDKFHLDVKCRINHKNIDVTDDVKIWLRFALGRHAKEIKFYANFDFPKKVFPNLINQYLVTLVLDSCFMEPQIQVNLPSLKKLFLQQVVMCEETLQQFISGCPSLQQLAIKDPDNIRSLSFNAPNIDKLSLVLTHGYEDDNPMLFDFPKVKTLHLEIERIPVIIDVSSVRDIYFKKFIYDMDHEDERKMCKMFLGKFKDAEVFQLSPNASEPFLHSVYDLHLSQIRWKRLVLELAVHCDSCLLGIYQLMKSLKHLEELIIYTTKKGVYSRSWLYVHQDVETLTNLLHVELSSPCVMPKLKTVTLLNGYVKPLDRQLQLVEILLKSAINLDKLVIVPNHELTGAEESEFLKRVSSFRRASPSASVLFT